MEDLLASQAAETESSAAAGGNDLLIAKGKAAEIAEFGELVHLTRVDRETVRRR